MKKNLKCRFIWMLLSGVMLFTLFGCGKNNNLPENESEQQPVENVPAQSVENVPAQPSADTELVAKECRQMYEAFLNNEEPLYFTWYIESDNSKTSDWEYGPYREQFKAQSAYVFSDFVEKSCEAMSDEYGCSVYPQDISYAIIDCGDDNVPEMALTLGNLEGSGIDYTDVWIVKCIDNKLQVIQYVQYGYRSQFSINEYGYYQYGGASGAACWCIERAYLGADGLSYFDYGEENNTAVWSLYVADNSDYQSVAEELGIDENIEVEQFYFSKANPDDEYSDFQKNSMWNYYELDSNYDRVEDNAEIYSDGNPYKIFWDSTELPLNTTEEIERAVTTHRAEIGVNEKIVNGNEPEWEKLSEEQFDRIYAWKPNLPEPIVLDTPSWEYFCADEEAETVSKLKLEVENKTPNEIIDENVWFAAMGMTEPDRLCFSDGKYTYRLSGEDSSGLLWYPYLMDICEDGTDIPVYSLDFSNYYTPENITAGDESFVDESIHWAVADNDILYVSTFHNTYASSAPQNGYITALDMKDNFKVLWRTKPLTCNSSNFIVTDDAIICGYGFTAEDDYVYVLDKNTGIRTSSIKVKTSPEWFCLDGEQLFVRCYDTDYVFNVIK